MSIHAIKQYLDEVEKIVHFGGTKKETAVRNAFYNLLNEYAKDKDLILVPEIMMKTAQGKNIAPDGTLKDSLRQDWGYWESKDEADDIDEEIRKKFAKGYPKDNIIFEDSITAVLFQNGTEVQRVKMKEAAKLDILIRSFIDYERAEVSNFRKAIELFKEDVPHVSKTLRNLLEEQERGNPNFRKERDSFLRLCQGSINPNIMADDVREMIIQHILTEDIFNTIFDETQFHRENNIARQLEKVIETFFTGMIKRTALAKLQSYSQIIKAAASNIADHHEKQKFLKVVYETFYKSYNPKAADRLGVVYTPNEIVKFMIESTDYLLHKHFGKFLEDKGVEILDPATGTGTFVCDIIDFIGKEKLAYKYQNELHANEVAILPYYVSNLNIEFTYKQKTGSYAEFENLCFVDTLDNMGFAYKGKQIDMFGGISEENSQRIKRQNERKISVIIGNPPYNANQSNENDNNKNREYPEIDKRIKDTFIHYSTAQKTKVYDMYARFYRWAFDRLNENGIVAFVTNRSFIDSRTFDGFRKTIQKEFDFAYIIDTKSDVRANPKIAGTTHNVFGIQTGVAIMFLVKKEVDARSKNQDNCTIRYATLEDDWRKEEKLQWFAENKIERINFENIQPDPKHNWINLADNDFETLLPLVEGKQALFEKYSMGVVTARDEWVYDTSKKELEKKMKFFIDYYNKLLAKHSEPFDTTIKWSDTLKRNFKAGKGIKFDNKKIVKALYKPYNYRFFYAEKVLNDRLTSNHVELFGKKYSEKNVCFGIIGKDTVVPFSVLGFNAINDLNSLSNAAGGNKTFALYRYDAKGNRIENITDWGLQKFQEKYGKKGQKNDITKEAIFHYVYAVLHHPAYRKKYELNLKREFPRIPFYDDFEKWASWGKQLMELHIGYEKASLFQLKTKNEKLKTEDTPKAKLKADKENGVIILDEETELHGIPKEAWEYKLGNRSALEWILDQYKEKKPSDPTIAEQFNTYKFADYKNEVIELLQRVCTVSVETMKIVGEMEG